jgi:hypothetical protein
MNDMLMLLIPLQVADAADNKDQTDHDNTGQDLHKPALGCRSSSNGTWSFVHG